MKLMMKALRAVGGGALVMAMGAGAWAAGPPEVAPVDEAVAPVAEPAPAVEEVPAALPAPLPAAEPELAPVVEPVPEAHATPTPEAAPLRPHAEALAFPIALSGYFWVDSGYMSRDNARSADPDQDANYMQGRCVLAAEYYQELDGLFAKARTEFIGFVNEFTKSQFEAHVLDAYAQFGQKAWDFQIGRFLAWEVYHRGAGIELYTAEEAGALGGPALYWLQLTRGLKDEAGQLAFHLYPTDWLGVEVAGVYGQESNQNVFGVRPVVDFHLGGFQAIAGFEYLAQRPQKDIDKTEVTSSGFAAKLQYSFPWLTVGADFAMGSVDYTDIQGLTDSEKTLDRTSVGGFANLELPSSTLGVGFHYTTQDNEQGEQNTHQQAFVSYLFRLPIDGLSLKAVYGFALANIEDADVDATWENSMHSVRLRLAYDFQ